MNFYWLYDIPTWALFAYIVGTICTIAVGGCLFLRKRMYIWLTLDDETNEIVSHFLSFTGVFYGLILGLVAVGSWDTYNSADNIVQTEAAHIAALYSDVSQLPEPHKSQLQGAVRNYTASVIDDEWHDQQQGILPLAGDKAITILAAQLHSVPITNPNLENIITQASEQLDSLVVARRARILSATSAIPGSLWYVLIIGTMIILVMTWLLRIGNKRLDIIINLLTATMMGTVLSFIVAMDNPYRGELSVSAQPYQLIQERLMSVNQKSQLPAK